MHVHTSSFSVRTRGKGTYEITSQVEAVIRESGVRTGQVTVFIQHTTASLIIFENADPSARADPESYFDLPRIGEGTQAKNAVLPPGRKGRQPDGASRRRDRRCKKLPRKSFPTG